MIFGSLTNHHEFQDVIGEVGFGTTLDALQDENNEVCVDSKILKPSLHGTSCISVIRRCLAWYVPVSPYYE